MSAEQVGELYAELGIKDLTDTQMREAQRGLERSVQRMDRIPDPRVGVDTEKAGPALDRMERHLRSVTDQDHTITPDVDVSHIDDGAAEGEHRISSMARSWGAAALVVLGAAGAAAGAEFVQQFFDWAERDVEKHKLAARLGLSEEESARYGKLAGQIYADNFGSSVAAVNDALAAGQSNGLFDAGDTEEQIRRITERALTMADVFGQDVPRLLAAASTMVKTGVAHDIWEAFDIITKGFQGPANKADDLLDTFNEYSTVFRALGIDGQSALGLLQQGLQGGARDSDLVADALKEFAIRGKDGSKAVSDAYHALGMDASDATDKLARGGDDAAGVLDDVLDRLRKIQDPTRRNNTAIALFGTQAEDLQDALDNIDPSRAMDGLGDVAGSAERAVETASDSMAGSLESMQRRAKIAVEDYLGSLWEAYDEGGIDGLTEKLGKDFDKLADWWDENGDVVTDRIERWWDEHGSAVMWNIGREAAQALWDGHVSWYEDNMVRMFIWADKLVGTIRQSLGIALNSVFGEGEMWKVIPNGFIDSLNLMIDAWNALELELPKVHVPGTNIDVGGVKLESPEVPHLPHFATGGVVLGPKGSPVLALIHGGETVQTPEQRDYEDQRIRDLERRVADGGRDGRSGGGNVTNIYTWSPERYERQSFWGPAA